MRVGYGVNRIESDFRHLGCERVVIDSGKSRAARAAMLEPLGDLRKGDTLVVFSWRELAGSTQSVALWREKLAALNITVEVHEDDRPAPVMGRPVKFDWNGPKRFAVRDMWLNWRYTEKYRLEEVERLAGVKLSKGALFHHFGSVSAPKPEPDEKA